MRLEAAATTLPRHATPGGGADLTGITDDAAPDLTGRLDVLAEPRPSTVEPRTVDGLAVADSEDGHLARAASTPVHHGVRVVSYPNHGSDGSRRRARVPAVAQGCDGYAVLERIAPHVHVEDTRGTTFVDPGAGEAGVRDRVRLLRSTGCTGAWSLEPHVALQSHRSDRWANGAAEAFVGAGRAFALLPR